MAEEAAIDLTIKTGDAEKNTQSLKSKLKELKQELAGLEEGSDAFNKIAKEAGLVQDKIGDINKRVNNLASDTKKLDAVVGVAQGIAGGFAAAQGAIALFGQENEDLNKTLVKVQGSIALLNGVQQIANTLNKESAAMITLTTYAQSAWNFVIGTTNGLMKLLRIAIAATGIGALVVGLGLLVANFDSVVGSLKNVINRFDFLKITIEKLGQAWSFVSDKVRDFLSQFGLMDSAAEHHASVLNEQTIKDLDRVIKAKEQEISIRKALGQKTFDLEQELFDARIAMAKAKGEDETAILVEQMTAQRVARDEAAKLELEAEKKRQEEAERYKKEIADKREENKKIEEEIAKMRREQELEDQKDQDEAMQAQLDEAQQHVLNAQANLNSQQEADARNAKARAAARIGLEQSVYSSLASIAGSIGTIGKKSEKLQRAMAIAQLAIDTARAISSAIASVKVAVTPVDYGLQVVAAVAIVAANIAQAAKLLGAKNPATGGGEGGAPDMADTGLLNGNNAPGVPSGPQSTPVPQQVFVTETDISGILWQVNVIESLSTIE